MVLAFSECEAHRAKSSQLPESEAGSGGEVER
jgi:hypothetical protein